MNPPLLLFDTAQQLWDEVFCCARLEKDSLLLVRLHPAVTLSLPIHAGVDLENNPDEKDVMVADLVATGFDS
jgi:hypothetical protein